MEPTIIGVIVIVLSIIAFFKNEYWLLYLTVFFSTFTAASIFTSGITLTLYKVPMLLWILKQIIIFIKSKSKITLKKVKSILKENRLFIAILIFMFLIIVSNVWLLISGLNHEFYDKTYLKNEVITFEKANVSQTIGIMQIFVFLLILSLKKIDNNEIKKMLNVFFISTFIAVLWGFIQFTLYYLDIKYPAFLFNNNPGYTQHYNQVMYGVKRVNSIATEPSVFGLNLISAIPIILIPWLYNNMQKMKKVIISFILAIIIICTYFTTSTTALVGLIAIMGILVLYLFIMYIKEKKDKEYGKKIIRVILFMFVCTAIFLLFLFIVQLINNDIKNSKDGIKTEVSSKEMDMKDTLKEMTVSKISSGSGKQRLDREFMGLEIYTHSPIFGVGYVSFRTFTLFTNVLVNVGILGLIAWLYIIFITLKTIILNRKKDIKYCLIFSLSIAAMLSVFAVSIPDLIYIYFWIILILGYRYFKNLEENLERKKIK